MEHKARGIDEIIQQAMRAGAFDNLRGKGKPLDLDENPYLDPEWQLAYHLLKQNGFAPQFIEQRQAIEMELATARQNLTRTWAWRQRALERGEDATFVETEWARAKNVFEKAVEGLNKRIKHSNLEAPSTSLSRGLIVIEREIERAMNL
jgi:DnaJ family protein C protein 28